MVHIFSPLAGHKLLVGWMVSGLIVAMALAMGGCASVPPPDNAMNLAQSQLQAARDVRAADYAPVDLGFAQDKFQQAQTAMAQRHYADAATLAEESRTDAELAQAKARLGAARAQMQSKLEENNRLRAQGDRSSAAGSSFAAPPRPAADNNQSIPSEQPQDMPAPASSLLSAPPAAGGFQTVPEQTPPTDDGHPGAAHSAGDQP